MGIDFVNTTKKDLLHYYLYPMLNKSQKCFIVTANPEIVMKTREDASYKNMVEQADFVVPDGAGIVLASKYQKAPIKERIPGYELMIDLLDFANKQELSCFFLGAKDYVNQKLVLEVEKKYPNIKIAGSHHGFFYDGDGTVSKKVIEAKPDLVFVALGAPRQEKWITENMVHFQKGLFMGVGGSFDVLAGEAKRAPEKWINLNLEWLYRLLKQPLRWKRILKACEFMLRIFLKKQ